MLLVHYLYLTSFLAGWCEIVAEWIHFSALAILGTSVACVVLRVIFLCTLLQSTVEFDNLICSTRGIVHEKNCPHKWTDHEGERMNETKENQTNYELMIK